MSATSISFSLLIVLFMILLLRWMRRLKPQLAGFQSQRNVPILRIDHVPIKAALLGVRRSQFSKAVSVTVEQ
jgi:hypothetical protein